MNVLVLNAGSSSLKFQLIETSPERIQEDSDRCRARGMIERIGGHSVLWMEVPGSPVHREAHAVRDQHAALDVVLGRLTDPPNSGSLLGSLAEIDAVGHRVVHGGEYFRRSVLIDGEVLERIADTVELAPLHNPHNLKGIQAARAALGSAVPQAAVFDTSFHHTLPEHAYLYAIPYSLYRRHRVRRYGFHGTSHRYVAYRYRTLTGRAREDTNLISLHLGNGCSICAIAGGDSIDTSMGFTPLEGLVMGTRSGDVDPAVLDYVAVKEGMSLAEVESLLNKQSGLLGISGLTHDMRDLLEELRETGDRRAGLAIQIFAYRARKYIGAYLAAMGGADAVVFTGGIGANAPEVRRRICAGLEWLGLELDPRANEAAVDGVAASIGVPGSRLSAWVIPTDEELLIARDTVRLVLGLDARY